MSLLDDANKALDEWNDITDDDNGENFPDGPWCPGWERRCGCLFETKCVYILDIENSEKKRDNYVGCYWDGEDFCPLKTIYLVDPCINANESIDNRVKILSIRKM